MKYSNAIIAAVGALTLGLAFTTAHAATTTTATMDVSATVQATCVVSTTPMAFGTYTGALVNSTSTVIVTCTNGTSYTLGLDQGLASGATVTNRSMTGPGGNLNYGLYSDAGHSSNFATLASATGTGSAVTTTVYGQMPAGQYVTPGSYDDKITATVTY